VPDPFVVGVLGNVPCLLLSGDADRGGISSERSREIMAESTLPHGTIGAALTLVATAVAAEPMGEATRTLVRWEAASELSSNMFPSV
jgi:hypothetical protein